jgi:hypothetical protein
VRDQVKVGRPKKRTAVIMGITAVLGIEEDLFWSLLLEKFLRPCGGGT